VLNDAEREQGVPKLALVPSRAARAELSRTLGALTARLGLGESGQNVLTLRTSMLDGTSSIHDPERELGTLSQERGWSVVAWTSARRSSWPLLEQLRLSVAANGNVETLERRDADVPTSAKASTLRGVTRLDWQPGRRVSLFGLLSAQCRSTEPGQAGCERFEPTGRIGAGLRGKGFTLFANLGRYPARADVGRAVRRRHFGARQRGACVRS